jgi:hypothetical protein
MSINRKFNRQYSEDTVLLVNAPHFLFLSFS